MTDAIKKTIAETLAEFDTGLAQAQREVNAIYHASQHDESLLDLYEQLQFRVTYAEDMLVSLRGITTQIGIQRAARYAASERFYVYISHQYGKEIEASIDSLSKASSNVWHDLKFAAGNWKRMEDINTNRKRQSSEVHYWIMAYDPVSGRIRKLTREEIHGAMVENFEATK